MEVSGCRLLLFAVALRDQQNDFVFRQRGLDGRERRRAPNQKGDDYIGENDDIPQRQDRYPVRRRDGLVIPLKDLRQGLFWVFGEEEK
jgi:hypothetical protein